MAKATEPSDPRVRGIRLQHPTDETKVIQIELVNTGNVDATDGTEIWALGVGSGGGPIPSVPSENKHAYYELPDTDAHALPTRALVNGGTIIMPDGNVGNVIVGGDATITTTTAPSIPPGGSFPISAQNLNQIFVKGAAADIITFIGG